MAPSTAAVDVGVVEHDEGRVAAQFQRQLLDGGCALRHQDAAHFGGAGEGQVAHHDRWRKVTLPTAIELSPSAVSMLSTPAGMPARSRQLGQRPAPTAASVRRA